MSEKILRSESGRKLRKDSAEYKFGIDKLNNLISEYYLQGKLSAEETSIVLKEKHGIDISNDIVLRLAQKFNYKRTHAEALSLSMLTMKQDRLIDDSIKNIIDGLNFGDGCIVINKNTRVGRLQFGSMHEEFSKYCSNLLSMYMCSEPHYNSGTKGVGMWSVKTLYHRDFYEMYLRWSPNGIKQIPADIDFNPTTILLWYLGDGCLSSPIKGNARYMYFATNCFSKESLERIVVPKFSEIGIKISRITEDSRVFIATDSINDLLQYMGGKSPVSCFDYKFDIEEWRTFIPMHRAAIDLKIDYARLANWVKQGLVEHNRSPGGKKVVFTPEQMDKLSKRLDSGELPREKSKKRKINC